MFPKWQGLQLENILSIFVESVRGRLHGAPCPLSDWARLLGFIVPLPNEAADLQLKARPPCCVSEDPVVPEHTWA